MKFSGCLSVCLLFLLLPCCCHLTREVTVNDVPDPAIRAQSLISDIKTRNDAVDAVKGIGKVTLRETDAIQNTRTAWLAAPDGRIRIEMLGPAGFAVAKFIFDGATGAYVSHEDQQVYMYPGTAGLNLKPLTGVPVPADDIVRYLIGAVPVRDYDGIHLSREDITGREVLVLKKWWQGTVQKIYPGMDGEVAAQVEFYGWGGGLTYRAELGRFHRVGGRWIPFLIHVTDGADNGLRIEVDKCWTGFPLTPEMFLIGPIHDAGRRF
jgi:hypothetical protein